MAANERKKEASNPSLFPLDQGKARKLGAQWRKYLDGSNPLPVGLEDGFYAENPRIFSVLSRLGESIQNRYSNAEAKIALGACVATYQLISQQAKDRGHIMPVVNDIDVDDLTETIIENSAQFHAALGDDLSTPLYQEQYSLYRREELSKADQALVEIADVFGEVLKPEFIASHEGNIFKGMIDFNIFITYSLVKQAFEREDRGLSLFPLGPVPAVRIIAEWNTEFSTEQAQRKIPLVGSFSTDNPDLFEFYGQRLDDYGSSNQQLAILWAETAMLTYAVINQTSRLRGVPMPRATQTDIDQYLDFIMGDPSDNEDKIQAIRSFDRNVDTIYHKIETDFYRVGFTQPLGAFDKYRAFTYAAIGAIYAPLRLAARRGDAIDTTATEASESGD